MPRPRRKEQWPHRRLNQTYLLVLESLLWRCGGQGHWQQQSWNGILGVSPLEVPWRSPLTLRKSPQTPGVGHLSQLTGRESNPTYQWIGGLKFHQAWPCPLEQDCFFQSSASLVSGNLHKPLSLIYQRADRRRRTTILQQLEGKPHHRKLIIIKKQRVLSQMKGQGKTPEKQPNEMEMGNLPEKEFRIVIVKII